MKIDQINRLLGEISRAFPHHKDYQQPTLIRAKTEPQLELVSWTRSPLSAKEIIERAELAQLPGYEISNHAVQSGSVSFVEGDINRAGKYSFTIEGNTEWDPLLDTLLAYLAHYKETLPEAAKLGNRRVLQPPSR